MPTHQAALRSCNQHGGEIKASGFCMELTSLYKCACVAPKQRVTAVLWLTLSHFKSTPSDCVKPQSLHEDISHRRHRSDGAFMSCRKIKKQI